MILLTEQTPGASHNLLSALPRQQFWACTDTNAHKSGLYHEILEYLDVKKQAILSFKSTTLNVKPADVH